MPATPPLPTSGTLASHDDTDDLPVVDEGVAVAPEELGPQFLRDATQQNNFERQSVQPELEPEAQALGQMISDATLSSSGQEQRDVPDSTALLHDGPELEPEPERGEGSLISNAMREASLFDQPVESEAGEQDVVESQVETDETAALDEHRAPPGTDEDAREQEKRRLRKKLLASPDRRRIRDKRGQGRPSG